MFTWICPKCGKEVPPHESECPFCHGTGKVEEPPAAAPPPPPQPPAAAPPPPQQPAQPPPPPPPPVAAPPPPPPPPQPAAPPPPAPPPAAPRQQPAYQQQAPPPPQYPAAPPPPQYAPPPPPAAPTQQEQEYYEIGANQRHMPGWLVTIIVALVVGGIGALLYYYVLPSNRNGSAAQTSPFEEVPEAETTAGGSARIARHIEVTGFRISEDEKQRAQVQFLVVNHSAADIGDLAGTVYLTTTESKPDDEPILKFDFKTTNLGPYESIEFKTIVPTKLRAYELPDWQFLRARVEITSPKE